MAIVDRHAPTVAGRLVDERRECELNALVIGSLRYLAKHQNADGGWGDSDHSPSNIATTMLVRAAFALTCVPANCPGLLERADAYIAAQGGVRGLKRRYGKDRALAVPVLITCALAGLVDWNKVPAVPFELVCLPRPFWRLARLPIANFTAVPLVAMGQVRFAHKPPLNPITRFIRRLTFDKSLAAVEDMHPADGGFLEAAPLTSFVVICLATSGRANHPLVHDGVRFLLETVRPDGSWPISTNLAVRNTAHAVQALATAGENVGNLGCIHWLLAAQHRRQQAYTGAQPGGWAWTERTGGVPDVDDTCAALLALADATRSDTVLGETTVPAAASAVRWLLDVQNSDGGWPTFCRGAGATPFDRSGADLTAHALRALHAWRRALVADDNLSELSRAQLDQQIAAAIEAGLRFLAIVQKPAGYWLPLWFGNPHRPAEDNPVYGTSKVVFALRDLKQLQNPSARRALDWLTAGQNADGSFGGAGEPGAKNLEPGSIEETSLAVEALLTCGDAQAHEDAALKGLKWLVDAVEANRHTTSAPIGFYFARLWYDERLYPLTMIVSALGQAARRLLPQRIAHTAVHSAKR